MIELLAPAGSPEAVIAAVQNGADAVYLGMGNFNARRGAKNFTDEEFEKAVRYCRIRGCKVYVTLNTLVNDREIASARRHHHPGSGPDQGHPLRPAGHPPSRQHPDEHP